MHIVVNDQISVLEVQAFAEHIRADENPNLITCELRQFVSRAIVVGSEAFDDLFAINFAGAVQFFSVSESPRFQFAPKIASRVLELGKDNDLIATKLLVLLQSVDKL